MDDRGPVPPELGVGYANAKLPQIFKNTAQNSLNPHFMSKFHFARPVQTPPPVDSTSCPQPSSLYLPLRLTQNSARFTPEEVAYWDLFTDFIFIAFVILHVKVFLGTNHSLANWDSCPTPAKSEAVEYLQVGPTEIRYSIAWTIFV